MPDMEAGVTFAILIIGELLESGDAVRELRREGAGEYVVLKLPLLGIVI